MKPVLVPGRNCWKVTEATSSAVLVDGAAYYQAFYRAAERAKEYILMCGWQFDSTVSLLRGQAAEGQSGPVELIRFLDKLCQTRPELRVYMLAWDYSLVYALEREWMQAYKFNFTTSDGLRFEFDAHAATGGSHHQKFVVVDGAVGFCGGMDICESRWDDREHRLDNPLRVDREGKQYKPYHDVQVGLTGPAVTDLVSVFRERWRLACGEELDLAEPKSSSDARRFDLKVLSGGDALAIDARQVALSRTQVDSRSTSAPVREILALHEDAIAVAEELIYVETQYFTSRSVAKALIERMGRTELPKLQILIVMPYGADSPKEKFVLGDSQDAVLASLLEAALAFGHQLRLLYSVARDETGGERPTFIHSKILIVDDQLLSVGSANLTNRSMGLDSELNLVWQCATGEDPLSHCIRRVRASLLAEHAGLADPEHVGEIEGLTTRLDALCDDPKARLRRRLIRPPENVDPLLCAVFDPDGPGLLELNPSDWFGTEERGFFARGIQSLGQRLAKADTPTDEPPT